MPVVAAGQTYTLSPAPFLEIRNTSGAIVSGGCIRTMLTGTTTDAATYTTSSGTLNANPIIADSDGKFVAYLQPGTVYRFRYEATPCSAGTPGATIRTVDGIAAVPVSGQNVDVTGTAGEALSLADLVYLSDGSGSLTAGRWYQADADNTYSSTTAVALGFTTAACASGATTCTIRLSGRMTGLSLTAGDLYYASATAAALTTTPPTNARCIGKADSTTTLILPCDANRLTDSDGTHSLVMRTSSDLTADRTVTMVPGDASTTLTLPVGTLTAVRVYTANDTWTKPSSLHSVVVWVVGGGGGGGGVQNPTGAGRASVGAGGGGGGASMKRIAAASLGATETVTVGAGGTAGASGGGAGGTGGTSSLGAHASATGGSGGGFEAEQAGPRSVVGGAGGAGSSGDLNLAGDAGSPGYVNSAASAGFSGNGGSSSGAGGGGAGRTSNGAGSVGRNYGGGGSGALTFNGGADAAGGAGAAGVVIVYELTP